MMLPTPCYSTTATNSRRVPQLICCHREFQNTPEEDDETSTPCPDLPPDLHSDLRPDLHPDLQRDGSMAGSALSSRRAGPSYTPYQPPVGLPVGYSQPTPFPSQADGSWLHPSYTSAWPGPYPSSLPSRLTPPNHPSYPGESCYSRGRSLSLTPLPGRDSPSMTSLEQPHSLHSIPLSAGFYHHSLTPYTCCAQCPVEGFNMGPYHSPQPIAGYRLPSRPMYNYRLPGAGDVQSGHMSPHPNPCSAPLSVEQRRVFVTYEADSDKHVKQIINFVALLRHNGFDTHIDMFEQQFRSISKIDFMERYLSEKEYLIIIIISPKYHETVTSSPVSLENDERILNTVYIHKQCHVPTWLQNTHVYSWPRDRDDVLRRLMRIEKYNPPPIGKLPTIVSIPI
ncbi:E3 ubiquitin ligase TRAF3IP2-like isoform X3 [Oncorhynchus keta]|uniref:E3 ubiquitin ligase TRAF3IP2-like isoform X3 n=1 Tax=Oncorhynchus keta TaxID=8018 RepID=UPI00227AED79|nr:E3 ubiquitin ligase TRAF3IP2-like isoform X3 [Oncorhynchus keta]